MRVHARGRAANTRLFRVKERRGSFRTVTCSLKLVTGLLLLLIPRSDYLRILFLTEYHSRSKSQTSTFWPGWDLPSSQRLPVECLDFPPDRHNRAVARRIKGARMNHDTGSIADSVI